MWKSILIGLKDSSKLTGLISSSYLDVC